MSETTVAAAEPAIRRRGFWRGVGHRVVRQPVTLGAATVLVAILGAGEAASVLAPSGWNAIDLSDTARNHGPTFAGHLLGTDQVGRDTLHRVLWGVHFSEQTAVVGGAGATVLAIVAGLTAGWFAGWFDVVVMRIVDLVSGFPVLVILIVMFSLLRPVTVWETTAVFALAMWPFAARVFRARAASLRQEEFVQAAQALGASSGRIVFRHLLPNAAGAIVISLTSLVGQIVLIEATAEFFGFGVLSSTRPTLGNLLGEATQSGLGPYNFLGLGWWTWTVPAVVLILLLASVNLVGDGLDAALNPRAVRA
ncbi:MAG TPA: ABC transporter permease [Gaiellaceae bacterium]|nr:ABC transporter permease [Gaiellaceae bacterium]